MFDGASIERHFLCCRDYIFPLFRVFGVDLRERFTHLKSQFGKHCLECNTFPSRDCLLSTDPNHEYSSSLLWSHQFPCFSQDMSHNLPHRVLYLVPLQSFLQFFNGWELFDKDTLLAENKAACPCVPSEFHVQISDQYNESNCELIPSCTFLLVREGGHKGEHLCNSIIQHLLIQFHSFLEMILHQHLILLFDKRVNIINRILTILGVLTP